MKGVKRFTDKMRNNLRALLHTRLDRTQRRLLLDVVETLGLLEEVLKSESELATPEEN